MVHGTCVHVKGQNGHSITLPDHKKARHLCRASIDLLGDKLSLSDGGDLTVFTFDADVFTDEFVSLSCAFGCWSQGESG